MTDKENITAILECYFTGFKKEIIDSACNRILEQEPSGDLISREETLTAFADYVGSGMSMNDYEALWDIVAKMPSVKQEPCEDSISRQAVLDIVNNPLNIRLDEIIKKLPPVTPQPKTGHWIWCVGSHKCSNCEEYTWFSHKELLRYCPNCGAKMESEG